MSKRKYAVRRRPKLCRRHLNVSDEFGPGFNFINLSDYRYECDDCQKFFRWVSKVWEDAAPKRRA